VDTNGETRIQTSIRNYFVYLRDIEFRNLKRLVNRSGMLLIIGLGLIILNVKLPLSEFFPKGMIGSVLSEGLIIAAWVSLWEVFANIIMKWLPFQQRIRTFTRISKAAVFVLSGIGKKTKVLRCKKTNQGDRIGVVSNKYLCLCWVRSMFLLPCQPI
jgi:hypothetical protein